MRRKNRVLSSLLLGAVLSAPFLTTACAVHSREVYDPYHNDYHRWNHDEDVQYHQWIVVSHKPDRPYKNMSKDDQKAYWDWRHSHGDNGQSHDRDHDHH